MNSESECPICMDTIGVVNCMTTECGHIFHANCLMKNIDRNGFTCPCCRSQMVEEHDQLDVIDEYQDEQEEQDDEEDDEERQLPSIDFVAEKLREQGVTFEQLIAWTLLDHTKYVLDESENDERVLELETYSGDIYEKFKTIIDNFNTETVA